MLRTCRRIGYSGHNQNWRLSMSLNSKVAVNSIVLGRSTVCQPAFRTRPHGVTGRLRLERRRHSRPKVRTHTLVGSVTPV